MSQYCHAGLVNVTNSNCNSRLYIATYWSHIHIKAHVTHYGKQFYHWNWPLTTIYWSLVTKKKGSFVCKGSMYTFSVCSYEVSVFCWVYQPTGLIWSGSLEVLKRNKGEFFHFTVSGLSFSFHMLSVRYCVFWKPPSLWEKNNLQHGLHSENTTFNKEMHLFMCSYILEQFSHFNSMMHFLICTSSSKQPLSRCYFSNVLLQYHALNTAQELAKQPA